MIGKVIQSRHTSMFITKLPEMLAFINALMTLEPGDVASTGTPVGIDPTCPGDEVEVVLPEYPCP